MTSRTELAALGQSGLCVVEGFQSHIAMLRKTPVSHFDLLSNAVTHRIDFATYDARLRELDAAVRKYPEFTFDGPSGPTSLRSVRDDLADALREVEPFRRLKA